MSHIEGEYVKNNTRFVRPPKHSKNTLLKRNVVFISSENLKQNVEALMAEDGINTLRLTNDFQLDNLDFLKEHNFDFIKSIDLLSDFVTDVAGIYHLKNLISINCQNQLIDYSKFGKLKSVGIETVNRSSIEKVSAISGLERLGLMNKFSETDLSSLSKNKSLKQLTVRGSKLSSLKGLENLEDLEILNLFHNRSLLSLEGLTSAHKKLREIHIYSAPKLFDVNNHLMNVPQLTFLQLGSKKVDSFKFLDSMNNLETVGIHNLICKPADGDQAPLLNALKRTNGKIW